ncbi:plasmid replication protein RepC-4 (plasmid) [Phaeobacter gallaeciensis DSM 26640]|nr:plasmid replication protein RepC-4 [Phaeobacter gallaeciensis DSM 26640]
MGILQPKFIMAQFSKWKLLRAAEDAREPLGLKATSLNLLRSMIALIPGDTLGAAPDQHICFASNQTLAARAHVSVPTIERHVSILVNAGLIKRATTMNGKRWARRDGQGRVVTVSGLSLAPLFEKYAELVQIAKDHAERLLRLDVIRDRCKLLLARLSGAEGLLQRARNILRRRADEETLNDLYIEMTSILRDSDTPFEGHKETKSIPSVKDSEIEETFPRLCAEIRTARSTGDCHDRMDQIASELHLGSTWAAAKAKGPAVAFMLLGYILQRIERINVPGAYLRDLLQRIEQANDGWKLLMQKAL